MGHGAAERQAIDIEEFERRLRGPAPRAGDPLAELARLVTPADANPQAIDRMFAARRAPGQVPVDLDAAAMDAHLRQAFAAQEGHYAAEQGPTTGYADSYAPENTQHYEWSEEDGYAQPAPPAVVARARSKRPLYATAAVIAVGLLGIGSTFAFKGKSGGSGEVAEIKASSNPVKVQGPAVNAGTTASSESSVMDRGGGGQPVSRVVDRGERPVDMRDATRPRAISTSIASTNPIAALTAATENDVPAFAEPRKVKTVSVKPDGTIVSSTTASVPRAAAATPSTGEAAPAKSSTPKAATRAATTPKPDTADSKPEATRTAAAKPATRKPARDADDDTAADATPTATTGRSRGGFSVQLAAPGSETDAKAQASRLGQKYSDALGGARLSVQKAEDKEIYRVRTASMSRDDAVAACEKVKAAGGGCFVSKN